MCNETYDRQSDYIKCSHFDPLRVTTFFVAIFEFNLKTAFAKAAN